MHFCKVVFSKIITQLVKQEVFVSHSINTHPHEDSVLSHVIETEKLLRTANAEELGPTARLLS